LQIRGAMLGADAVVDVHAERLPKFNRTVWCLSGTAVQTVDQVGLLETRSLWFGQQVAAITSWMLWLVTISFLLNTLSPFLLMAFSVDVTRNQRHFAPLFSVTIFTHIWPLIIILLLRVLQWPQLIRATAIAVVPLGASSLLFRVGEISWPHLDWYRRVCECLRAPLPIPVPHPSG